MVTRCRNRLHLLLTSGIKPCKILCSCTRSSLFNRPVESEATSEVTGSERRHQSWIQRELPPDLMLAGSKYLQLSLSRSGELTTRPLELPQALTAQLGPLFERCSRQEWGLWVIQCRSTIRVPSVRRTVTKSTLGMVLTWWHPNRCHRRMLLPQESWSRAWFKCLDPCLVVRMDHLVLKLRQSGSRMK